MNVEQKLEQLKKAELAQKRKRYKDTVAEPFVGMREASQEKRWKNQTSSTELLQEFEVTFESKNHGNHLIVSHGGKVIDFWPSTGKWIVRNSNKKGRGVFRLFDFLGVDYNSLR